MFHVYYLNIIFKSNNSFLPKNFISNNFQNLCKQFFFQTKHLNIVNFVTKLSFATSHNRVLCIKLVIAKKTNIVQLNKFYDEYLDI